jgi:hypothetical protein
VRGYNGPPWRPNVFVPLGHRRSNGGNLYQVTKGGGTAASGGPTGTGTTIVDGTAHWAFVHEVTNDGSVHFGSANPQYKNFFVAQAPDDITTGFGSYYRYDTFGGASDVHGFMYGVSGAGGESGPGIMHAVNKSTLTEWPMHVPAGRAMAEFMWIGGCRVAFGTGAPTRGTWNKGDRIFYKGSAVSAGRAEGLVCTAEGTAGVYSGGRTATTHGTTMVDISDTAMSTLKDQQDFKVGDVLTINGVTSRVQAVSANGLQLTMGSSIPAASSHAITFHNPTFKEFGSIAA